MVGGGGKGTNGHFSFPREEDGTGRLASVSVICVPSLCASFVSNAQDRLHIRTVKKVRFAQLTAFSVRLWVGSEMLDPPRVEGARPPDNPVNLRTQKRFAKGTRRQKRLSTSCSCELYASLVSRFAFIVESTSCEIPGDLVSNNCTQIGDILESNAPYILSREGIQQDMTHPAN